MTHQDIRRYIRELSDLSTTPALLGKILSLVGDDTKSTEEIRDLISYDQAMAQRVLRVANSAFFAHSGQIRDIQQALLFLGLDHIRNIAVGMTVMRIFPAPGSFHIENLWVHSYEAACLASILSGRITVTQPEECFLAGLLHDIGRIILYGFDHERFHRIETTDSMLDQELTLFGCTHAEAGAWFAEEISLPTSIITSILHHHRPSAAGDERSLVSLVALAEALTRSLSPRVEDDGIWTREHDAILLEFSLSRDELAGVEEQFRDMQQDIERFFSVSE